MERNSQKLAPAMEDAIKIAEEKLNALPRKKSESAAIILVEDQTAPRKAVFKRVTDEKGADRYEFKCFDERDQEE